MSSRATHFIAASARDDALRRLRNVQRLVVVAGIGLAAGFAVLAHAATPQYQKRRATEVSLAVPGLRATPPARVHKRHHKPKRHRVPAAVAVAPVTQAPAPVQSAPPPAPTPPPAAPVQIQPPPAAPAPTPQPPVVTSGGS
jgi:protein TonB